MSYFNTTHETGQTLVEAKAKANTQNELIMDFFKGGAKFTPWGVYSQLLALGRISNSVPITSIRRSISSLYKEGYLVKLKEKRRERLGKPNYFYQKA
jgi:hypothetical protein